MGLTPPTLSETPVNNSWGHRRQDLLATSCFLWVVDCFFRASGLFAAIRPAFASSINFTLDISGPHFAQWRPPCVVVPQPAQILVGLQTGRVSGTNSLPRPSLR